MLKKNSLPTESEIRISLGDDLANIVFELSHEEISKTLGIPTKKSLVGPGRQIWMSPSDQLMGKNYLKPPIHTDCIKACTHNAILQIGDSFLEKYRQETEERMQVKFLQELAKEKNLNKAETRRAVELVLKKTREQYENRILELKSCFTKELESQLDRTINDCKLKMQEAILEERENISREMMEKMRDEVGFVTNSLHKDFDKKLLAEKQKMMEEFNEISRRDRLKTDAAMKEIIERKEEEFQMKFREFELQKIADLTYILCSERMRSCSEKNEIKQNFQRQMETVQKMLSEANQEIEEQKEKPIENKIDKQWEAKIIEIVKQFQKFINFAFDAVPGQAEFLLSLESLLTFELDKKNFEIEKSKNASIQRENLSKKIETHDQINEIVTKTKKNDKEVFKIEEFAHSRMQSLMRILKLYPSLKHILIQHIGKVN